MDEKSDCGWKYLGEGSDCWESGCGEELMLIEDACPESLCMTYCPFCGGKIIPEEEV